MRPDFCVPKVCLNLARRPDRRIQAWEQFRREGLSVDRLVAPDAMNVRDCRGWRNKLEAVCDSPFEETIFFDADMISTGPASGWFDLLGTDDVSFWQYARKREDSPDAMSANLMNPHRFCPYYGVEAVPVMLGGGHYFVRKSGRARAILDWLRGCEGLEIENGK